MEPSPTLHTLLTAIWCISASMTQGFAPFATNPVTIIFVVLLLWHVRQNVVPPQTGFIVHFVALMKFLQRVGQMEDSRVVGGDFPWEIYIIPCISLILREQYHHAQIAALALDLMFLPIVRSVSITLRIAVWHAIMLHFAYLGLAMRFSLAN